jgi:hypothetical protein
MLIRTSFSKNILKRMALFFAPSFLVAIKQLYLSPQDITNTGLCISLLETYATDSDEHIAMALCFLLSSLSLKVCI